MKNKDYRKWLLKRLQNLDYAAGYLANVLETENQETFLIALRNVLDAQHTNITEFSKNSGLSRQVIYHALSSKGNPRFSTLSQIIKKVGLKITFEYEKKVA